MLERYDRIYAEIHLDAVRENIRMLGNLVPGAKLIGVVKADGYGHGAAPVARAIEPYVWGYAVAAAGEAVSLREHGTKKPILVLGSVGESWYDLLIEKEIRPVLFEEEKAAAWSQRAVLQGKKAPIHAAVDTGMGRIGLRPGPAALEELLRIASLPGVELEGLFTHFSRADETDKEHARGQYAAFTAFCDALAGRGVSVPVRHCANSAAIMDLPQMRMDAVRPGIAMYGIYPSEETRHDLRLLPAMEIRSFITYVKEVEAGDSISYGGTFTATERMRVATVGAGYADGYPRGLSGCGDVLVCGRRAPILGRICMDQFMIDVTQIPEAGEGTRVTLAGRDGGEEITMEELAAKSGRFYYEIPCLIGKRVPRVYTDGGRVVGTKDYEEDRYEDFMI